jgi:hypothetical protein
MRALLQAGSGLAVFAAFALVAGCAPPEDRAADASLTGDEATAEAPQPFLIECTNAGGTVAGALSVNLGPGGAYCYRTSIIPSGGMAAPPPAPGLPSCWQVAKQLGCIGF